MSRLKEIHDWLKKQGVTDEVISNCDSSSVYLATEIMEYAHRNQKRVNGEDYAVHPMSVLTRYRNATLIKPDKYFCVDERLMHKLDIPFNGVQEVCLLHDVIEDSDFTIQEVEEIYNDVGNGTFFACWIKKPLELVTHDKSEDYDIYIGKCMQHYTSAMVKMLDLLDNSDITTLDKLEDNEYDRCKRYLKYAKRINDKYHFIEKLDYYRRNRNVGEE